MTDREREIINLIKENSLITQEEIAEKLNIARSSVAVHISNLMKKGYILGKRYIISENPYILTIGGTNIDIQGYSYSDVILHDSNPGTANITFGGVGKNIAENISKMGIDIKLISILGNDAQGKDLQEYLKKKNIDISDSLIVNGSTSVYMSIIDRDGEMFTAVSSMDIYKHLNSKYLSTKERKIEKAKILILDTNLERETLKYLTSYRNKTKLLLDTVSTKKALKVKDFIGDFHIIKPNRIEAETLLDMKIETDDDLVRAGEKFLEKGVEKVFISLGKRGAFYMDKNEHGIITTPDVLPISVTGGGDAFAAGIAYGEFNDFDIKESVKYALASSIITVRDRDTVSKNMNVRNIKKIIMEEL